jgi:hypothetical protein
MDRPVTYIIYAVNRQTLGENKLIIMIHGIYSVSWDLTLVKVINKFATTIKQFLYMYVYKSFVIVHVVRKQVANNAHNMLYPVWLTYLNVWNVQLVTLSQGTHVSKLRA